MAGLTEKLIKYPVFILLMLSLLSGLVSTLILLIFQDVIPAALFLVVFAALLLLMFFFIKAIRFLVRSKLLLLVSERKFLIITVSVSFIISLISILLIDSKVYSDFLKYHENAVKIWNGEYPLTYVLAHLGNVFLRRPLVNLGPVYAIFGPDLMAVQFYNAILHIATGLMLYYFIKDTFKRNLVARLSLIFFFCIPIAYLTMNIPSHDIPGLFFLVLGFLIFVKMNKEFDSGKNLLRLILLSLSLGLVIFIMQLSRSIGVFYFYGLLILLGVFLLNSVRMILHKEPQVKVMKKIMLLFILPIVTYYLLSYFLISGNINQGRFIMMFIATDTSENCEGAYKEIADYKRYYSLIQKEDKNDVALGKLHSELFYNYPDFLKLLVKKNNRLYRLGDDHSWAQSDDKSVFSQNLMGVMWIFNKVIRIFLFVFAIAGLFYMFKKYRTSNPFSIVLLTWLICSVLLILFGEVSPRYSYLFLSGIAVLSAIGFLAVPGLVGRLKDTWCNAPGLLIQKSLQWIAVTFIIVLLLAGVNILLKGFLKGSDLVYRDLRTAAITNSNDYQEVTSGLSENVYPQEKPLKFGIKLTPGLDSVAAEWRFGVQPGAGYEIRGFIRENNMRPYKVKTLLFADHISILPEEGNLLKKKQLKIRDDYSVGYFSFSPVYVENDTMTIRLVIDSGEGGTIKDGSNGTTITFLEFLQIVRIDPEQ